MQLALILVNRTNNSQHQMRTQVSSYDCLSGATSEKASGSKASRRKRRRRKEENRLGGG